MSAPSTQSDIVVIGSGIAGLTYALQVADTTPVLVLTKAEPVETNTRYAQGGMAVVTGRDDSFEKHLEDTITSGAGLCDERVVKHTVQQAPRAIAKLRDYGVQFDKVNPTGDFELGIEGGHSVRRILHAGDKTGQEIVRALLERAKAHPRISIRSDFTAIDLITTARHLGDTKENRVLGVYALNQATGTVEAFSAKLVMIAAGGAGKVYLYTSNPDIATGDGIAMAYRAGAEISNMEFFQFHPTCLFHPEAKSFLLTEALRGEGAVLSNLAGEHFMRHYDERKELAPRDIVARAIDSEMKRTGSDHVLLNISHRDKAFLEQRFPTVFQTTLHFGFDMSQGPVPVVPAAHYCCGGVRSDLRGATSLPGLLVAGESACTGLHGANRLASNSLMEAVVFASAAAEATPELLSELTREGVPGWDDCNTVSSAEGVTVSHVWQEVRRTMWNLVGIVRSDLRLKRAARRIALAREEVDAYYWHYRITTDFVELRNILTVADLIIRAARWRKESRGLHFNQNYPETDDANWKKDSAFIEEIASD